MDIQTVIEFLVNHRYELGKKVLNSPERWFFNKENLPEEIQQMIRPEHIGIYLSETPNQDEWTVLI